MWYMRIAHCLALHRSIPVKGYGGVERIVEYLLTEQVYNHDVTLYASGDSIVPDGVKLMPGCSKALGDYPYHYIEHGNMFTNIIDNNENYDIIHFHIDTMHEPFISFANIGYKTINTMHFNPMHFSVRYGLPYVAISNDQKKLMDEMRFNV